MGLLLRTISKAKWVHSCPKQLLSPGFPQPNPLIRSGAGGHQKTRSATVHASCPGRQLARRREPSHESCSNMALCGLPVANLSGGGCSGRSLPVQNEIGEKLFWTRLSFHQRQYSRSLIDPRNSFQWREVMEAYRRHSQYDLRSMPLTSERIDRRCPKKASGIHRVGVAPIQKQPVRGTREMSLHMEETPFPAGCLRSRFGMSDPHGQNPGHCR